MIAAPFIDIHTHPYRTGSDAITVQNIFPGEGFAAFFGRNFYSVGLHPWHIKSYEENDKLLQMVEDALEFDHVIFVGECGLDKKTETDFQEQIRVFKVQAFMAEEFEYPMIVHCVKAYNEVVEIHKSMKPALPWILHGYNGSPELTEQLSKRNFLFSFGQSLFNKKSKAVSSFKQLPLEKIFIETDEFDGTVEKIYNQAAKIKRITVDELKKAVWENFDRIERTITNRS